MRSSALVVGFVTGLCACGGAQVEGPSSVKIVGGEEATHEISVTHHLVALVGPNGEAFCTGTLIENDLIVTAAHCVKDVPPFKLAFGLNATDGSIPSEHYRSPIAIATHKNYRNDMESAEVFQESIDNEVPLGDIALILMDKNAPEGFGPAQIAPNPDEFEIPQGAVALLAGYGLTARSPIKDLTILLKQRAAEQRDNFDADETPTIESLLSPEELAEWQERIRAYKPDAGILRYTFVAIMKFWNNSEALLYYPKRGACNGDSGGPAFILVGEQGIPLLTGVASRASCDSHSIYTDVRKYHEWLAETEKVLRDAVNAPKSNKTDNAKLLANW